MKRFIQILMIAALAITCAVGCSNEIASATTSEEHLGVAQAAITSGEDDDGDSAVVALLVRGTVHCTGFLVTSNVVVTAAHCITPEPPDEVFFGTRPGKKGTTIAVKNALAHPDYDEDSLENDIGVIALSATAPAKPLLVHVAPFDDSYKGKELRIVGFGATGTSEGAMRKRAGSSIVQSFGTDTFRLKASPSQTCLGDSGGPAFAPSETGGETVIGIASAGDSDCKEYATHTRIDRHFSFIQSYAKKFQTRAESDDASSGCSAAPGALRSSSASSLGMLALAALGVAIVARRRRDAKKE